MEVRRIRYKKLMAKTPDTTDMVRQPGGRCRARTRHATEPPEIGYRLHSGRRFIERRKSVYYDLLS